MYSINAKKRPKKSRKPYVVLLIVVVIGVALAAAYWFTRKTPENLVIPNKDSSTAPESTTATPQPTQPPASSTDKAASGDEQPSQTPSGEPPKTPSGTFVSNHKPSLGAVKARMSVESVCNTSPGAKCYIEFTKDNLRRTLPAKTADKNGSVFWSWNVKDAKLTQGVWKITAYAQLNGHTKSATDAINLEVQP